MVHRTFHHDWKFLHAAHHGAIGRSPRIRLLEQQPATTTPLSGNIPSGGFRGMEIPYEYPAVPGGVEGSADSAGGLLQGVVAGAVFW